MSSKATQTVVQPKAQTRPAATSKSSHSAASLNHESIADHIAAFRKNGGRIEILGTTPLRASVAPASRAKNAAKSAPAIVPGTPATGKTAR